MISIAHFSRFITSHPPRARALVHVFTCWASFLHMLVITKPSYKHLHIHNINTNKTWASWCACAAVLSVKSHFKSFSFTPCGAAILIRREELHTRRRVCHVTRRFPGKWQLECLSFQPVSTVFAAVTRQQLALPSPSVLLWGVLTVFYSNIILHISFDFYN